MKVRPTHLSALGLLALAAPAAQAQQETGASSTDARLEEQEQRIKTLESLLEELTARGPGQGTAGSPAAAVAAPPVQEAPKRDHWTDRLSIRGYGQFRATTLFDQENDPPLSVPADRSVNENETLVLRRARVILYGDISDHVYVYTQADFSGSTGAPDQAVQMRDFYADIAFDDDKEFRVRPGVSKVPFGWVNLQSSQNRGPMERSDALNSTVEGERDYGLFFYWAPKEIRDLLRDLVRSGRKGSGDYGVVGFGPYSGQGLNRSDRNGELHWVARVSYPFQLANDQVFELGVMGHHGKFVPSVEEIGTSTPTFDEDGVIDQRVGVTAIWYPRPFGLEAEWNWGRGPQLSESETTIESEDLHGGYVQAGYLHKQGDTSWYPFTRWNFYDGGRKFGVNAPPDEVNELDVGLEWSPVAAVELTLMFTHTFWRTNTNEYPFDRTEDAQRLGLQLQFNF